MISFGLGVHLGTINPEDSETLRRWRNDPKIWRWTRQNDLIDTDQQQIWLDSISCDKSIQMYGVFHEQSLAGVAGFTSIDQLNGRAEFSLYIDPVLHGDGFGEKALKTLFYHGFKNMGLRLIWGETLDKNPAMRLFEKLGMTQDGTRREFYFKDGVFHNSHLISITKAEFLDKHGDRSCF